MSESLEFRLTAVDTGLLKAFTAVDTALAQIIATMRRVDTAVGAFAHVDTAVNKTATATDHFTTELAQLDKELTVARAALQKVDTATAGVGTAAAAAAKQTDTLSTSFGGAFKSGLAFAAGFAGFATVEAVLGKVVQGVQAAVGSMTNFETKMASVNTLVQGNVTVQGQLRDELLKLPPILGTTAEKAEGLYAVLQAGIEPSKAVAFLGEAAIAAKGGMTDLSLVVDTLASLMKTYGAEAGSASNLSDLLFQTVNVGRGNLSQFANAFSSVAPMAKEMGMTLDEVGATLGTLSYALPNAAEGATGLRSIFVNLSQHMAEFRALGIDVQKVIGEEGLTGFMTRLTAATGGNMEMVRKLIPDTQAYNAVLALTGENAKAQAANIVTMATKAGAAQGAFRETTKTTDQAWKEFTSTLDHLVNDVGPPVLEFLTTVAKGATKVAAAVRTGIAAVSDEVERAKGLMETAEPVVLSFDEAVSGAFLGMNFDAVLDGFTQLIPHLTDAVLEFVGVNETARLTTEVFHELTGSLGTSEWNDFGDTLAASVTPPLTAAQLAAQNAAAATLAAAEAAKRASTSWLALGMDMPDVLQRGADAALGALAFLAEGSALSASQVTRGWEETRAAIVAQYGYLPQEFLAIDTAVLMGNTKLAQALLATSTSTTAAIREDVKQLGAPWTALGLAIPAALQQGSAVALGSLVALANSGTMTATQLTRGWESTADAIIAEFGYLPKEFAAIDSAIIAGDFTRAQALIAQSKTTTKGIVEDVKQIGAAWTVFGLDTPAMLQKTIGEMQTALQAMATNARTPVAQIQEAYTALRDRLLALHGTLPPGYAAIDAAIVAGRGATVRALVGQLQTGVEAETATVAVLTTVWENGHAKIIESGERVPVAALAANNLLIGQATDAAGKVVAPWQLAHERVMASLDATYAQIIAGANTVGGETRAVFEGMTTDINGRLVPIMEKGMVDVYGRMTTAGRAHAAEVRAAYEASLGAVDAAAQKAAVNITAGVRTAVEELAEMRDFVESNLGPILEMPLIAFATDLEALQQQQADTIEKMRGLAESSRFINMQSTGFFEHQMGVFRTIMAQLQTRIDALLAGGAVDLIPGFAAGGLVPGHGPPDSVLARVSPGEFLLPPKDVGTLMGLLAQALSPTGPQERSSQRTPTDPRQSQATILTPPAWTPPDLREYTKQLDWLLQKREALRKQIALAAEGAAKSEGETAAMYHREGNILNEEMNQYIANIVEMRAAIARLAIPPMPLPPPPPPPAPLPPPLVLSVLPSVDDLAAQALDALRQRQDDMTALIDRLSHLEIASIEGALAQRMDQLQRARAAQGALQAEIDALLAQTDTGALASATPLPPRATGGAWAGGGLPLPGGRQPLAGSGAAPARAVAQQTVHQAVTVQVAYTGVMNPAQLVKDLNGALQEALRRGDLIIPVPR